MDHIFRYIRFLTLTLKSVPKLVQIIYDNKENLHDTVS